MYPKTFQLFDFPLLLLWAYLVKIIPERRSVDFFRYIILVIAIDNILSDYNCHLCIWCVSDCNNH